MLGCCLAIAKTPLMSTSSTAVSPAALQIRPRHTPPMPREVDHRLTHGLPARAPRSLLILLPALGARSRPLLHVVGRASYVPQNEFPVFCHSGDVDILLRAGAAENRYLLHRDTLARCSGFFEASTSSQWSKAQPLVGSELAHIHEESSSSSMALDDSHPPKERWTYELHPGAGPGDIPMLVQKTDASPVSALSGRPAFPSLFGSKADSRSRPRPGHVSFSLSVADLSRDSALSPADQDLLRDYDNLFRIFYNYPPILDGVNVADAYIQCKSLLALADQYDALAVVGPRVDHHLLQFQSRLWKQIAKYPVSYLRLGYLARSKVIFQEALIHVVGQWPVGERSLRSSLPDVVMEIIQDKVDELEETISRVEGRLFRLNLTTPRGDRVAPSNSYLDWLAVSLFRQWLADNTTPQPPPTVSRNGRVRPSAAPPSAAPPSAAPPPLTSVGRAYRILGSGGSGGFLAHDDCKRFLKLTPELYSRENLRRFEKRMDELKALARHIVRPLLGSGLELDMVGSGRASEGIGYLTCTTVGSRDLPWPVEG
ncbi:hypothetical protein XA68_11160 [Ophiocordyceps unilateralis]|uniref:BTB domain-containing protein n=1 Tax=Ophiocordyceps unilateralis TaxID=268505 RepID=A0A2A9PGH5_OPHUN|nr:hypothetical protein XA68_11160 [Ophiocordyceps unilateralis]